MAETDDDFFSALPPEHAHVARAADDGDEIHLPSFRARFPRLEGDWLPLRWEPEAMTLSPAFRDALIAVSMGQTATAEAIVAAVKAALAALSETYGEDLAAAYGDTLPQSVEPLALTFHDVGGAILVGIEFNCDWDPESGLGLLMRDGRVLGVGFADVAFSGGVAQAVAAGETKPFQWTPPAA
ncbi:MAG: hypothetical protein H2042_03315 [Rhizobiales bacterium]|nr:hypothetical protein [Hyphomicrobiales bacterium]